MLIICEGNSNGNFFSAHFPMEKTVAVSQEKGQAESSACP